MDDVHFADCFAKKSLAHNDRQLIVIAKAFFACLPESSECEAIRM
jgi:hypothetical protein